ncbi:MAG: tetratricopeptide repeat protein, partial [Alphaproteobacteria bacterium]|nr:tetratricopeptide repeat protein [Alphaproteobacteria bacterium]
MTLTGRISGIAYSTDAPVALAAIDAFEDELLIYGNGAAVIFDAPRADPGLAAGHALAAAAHLFTMSPAGTARARAILDETAPLAARTSLRERLLVAAIRAWADNRLDAALDLHLEIAAHWPRDLLSAKIAVFHQLNRGDFAGMVRLTGRLADANPDRPTTLGMHAFALEQTGAANAAEAAGRTAAAAGFDPWAQHAVAHVMDSAGRHAEGADWMAGYADGWGRCSSFLRTHNWWHLALFRLDLDDAAGALALYDAHVWGVRKDYAQDQINAVSLLARLELRGVDVGARWQDVADFLEPRTGDHINA